jgi:hypothetical protein
MTRTAASLVAIVALAGCGPSSPPGGTQENTGSPVVELPDLSGPVAQRRYPLGKDWSITLPGTFRQETKDGTLILYRPGLTVCSIVWANDKGQSASERLAWIKQQVSAEAFDPQQREEGGVLRFSYRLTEKRKEDTVHALYGYAIAQRGHVQMAIYCDRPSQIELAREILQSATCVGAASCRVEDAP